MKNSHVAGNTAALSDEKGKVVERFGYRPYGEVVSESEARTPFLLNGQFGVMTDSNGLYYMRARFYSPEIKRFVNQDVLVGRVEEGQSLNRFAYVSGRPVSFVDPFGLDGESIGEPGFWEIFIPVWGSGRSAINDFQMGNWGWGIVNGGLTISDFFLVGFAVRGVIKGAWKMGSHTWNATRIWYRQTRHFPPYTQVHHWFFERNEGLGRYIPDLLKNQPWNLRPLHHLWPTPEIFLRAEVSYQRQQILLHLAIHGKTGKILNPPIEPYGLLGWWWYGTPEWAKILEISLSLKLFENIYRKECNFFK